MKIVIGLVGEKGSGKETFGDILKKLAVEKKVARVRSSDILNETLGNWDIECTRENLQDLAIIMDEHFGVGTLSHAVGKRINAIKADIIIFDGVRWMSDVTLIRSFTKSYLIYIAAPLKLRFERLKTRKQKKDEESLTLKQFVRQEKKKTELDIPKIAQMADVKIDNDSNLLELKQKIKQFYRSLS